MDNILDSAESSLAGLVGQREQLKGVKQKMLNIANQLGMSQTVIRLIGKRADQVPFFKESKRFLTYFRTGSYCGAACSLQA